MDIIIDSSFSGVYIMKLLRFCGAWLAVYMARRFFSADYIDSTVIGGGSPQRLTVMTRNFAVILLFIEIVIQMCVVIVSYGRNVNGTPWVPVLSDPAFMTSYVLDILSTYTLTIVLSYLVATVVGDRTVFQYIDQGARAARTLEEITVNIAAIVYLIPFFLIV